MGGMALATWWLLITMMWRGDGQLTALELYTGTKYGTGDEGGGCALLVVYWPLGGLGSSAYSQPWHFTSIDGYQAE